MRFYDIIVRPSTQGYFAKFVHLSIIYNNCQVNTSSYLGEFKTAGQNINLAREVWQKKKHQVAHGLNRSPEKKVQIN